MKFIDSHIHLQDYKQKCATDIIDSAQIAGAQKFICVAVVENDWEKIALWAEKYPEFIIPAFGLHPWYLTQTKTGWEKRLEQFLTRFPQALVGETGLDRVRMPDKEPQFEIFQKHISMAKQYCRPILIHAVKAAEWLDECWKSLPQKFVLHSFNGHSELMKKALKFGGYISFSASILLGNKDDVIKSVPAERLLIETDGPYQAKEKGLESNPINIPEQIKQLAAVRMENADVLAQQIYQNSLEFIKPW